MPHPACPDNRGCPIFPSLIDYNAVIKSSEDSSDYAGVCEVGSEIPLPSDPIQRKTTKEKKDKRARVFTFFGVGAGFASWGYFVIDPQPSIYFGACLLWLAIACFAVAFWDHFEWHIKLKLLVAIIGFAVLGIASMKWLVYEARPSFTFLVPGAVLNQNSWDFIVNHRGPKSSESVQILFTDDDKKKAILSEHPQSLTRQDINSYMQILNYPEINPNGQGQIFALQFMWTPLIFDHEHYTMEITDKDHQDIHQELQIERVNGKWFWATQITENGKPLLNCKDAGFPYGDKASIPCLPKVTNPGY